MAASTIGLGGAQAGGYRISAQVLTGIQQASASTGVDFGFLMAQAAKESGFNPEAKAKTSSASGLYQFVEQTWLSVVRKHGAEYGLGEMASKIKIAEGGKLVVADRALRNEILDLRRDPEIAAAMAAEHAADNMARLDAKLDREVTSTDLYLAHFLGLQGAVNFLRAMDANPSQAAASISPRAAVANKSIFYAADGTPRSLKQIYDRFEERIETDIALYDDLDDPMPATMLADVRSSGSLAGGGGERAVYGKTNPGGILSPFMLVTLAALPTARDQDEQEQVARASLFDQPSLAAPAA